MQKSFCNNKNIMYICKVNSNSNKIMKKTVFAYFLLCSIFSCTQQEEGVTEIRGVPQRAMSAKPHNDVSAEDALNVATTFIKGEQGNVMLAGLEDEAEVETITDSLTGMPLIYVVNFPNNGGFVLVSANKKQPPILAFSDEGHYNVSADLPSREYVEGYEQSIKAAYLDTSDSLRVKYALQWATFDNTNATALTSATSSSTITQLMEEDIKKREAQGWKHIGSITGARYYLPEDEYQLVIKDVSSSTDPNYDYEVMSQFYIKSFDYEVIEPLIGTRWHQGYPFNVDAPNGLAGCVPIAVAQILYYHQYPNKYDWSQIYKVPILTSSFKYFIKDVRDLCNVKYKENGTASTYDDAYNAFVSLGYTVKKAGEPNVTNLHNEIQSHRPVYIRGNNSKTGHAWVCEGYKNIKYEAMVTLVPRSDDHRFKLEMKEDQSIYATIGLSAYPPSSLDQRQYGEFFYMNLGWSGENSHTGWYRYNTHSADGEVNYQKEQKILTINK